MHPAVGLVHQACATIATTILCLLADDVNPNTRFSMLSSSQQSWECKA